MQGGRTYFHYHHSAADTLDKVVPSEFRENAAAVAVLDNSLTNMKVPLPRQATTGLALEIYFPK
jgi:hypothetical protein